MRNAALETPEEALVSRIVEPFPLEYQVKLITPALSAPLTSEQIREIAGLVTVGLLLGFVVRGEIDLGEQVIHNLGCPEVTQVRISRLQEQQDSSEARELPLRLSEYHRYLLAVDTGTTEYYNDALRREAFHRDEEQGREKEAYHVSASSH